MNRICIAALMTVMICASGCGPSEREVEKPTPRKATEATEKLLSLWDPETGDLVVTVEGSLADYIRVVIGEGADVNARGGRNGYTPLMYAASTSTTPEIVMVLLEAGARIEARENEYGLTPLMIAAGLSTTPEIVTLLLEAGADIEARATEYGYGHTPLMIAATATTTPEIVTLLLKKGADIEARSYIGMTSLMLVRELNRTEIIKLLKAAGAKE